MNLGITTFTRISVASRQIPSDRCPEFRCAQRGSRITDRAMTEKREVVVQQWRGEEEPGRRAMTWNEGRGRQLSLQMTIGAEAEEPATDPGHPCRPRSSSERRHRIAVGNG